MLTAEIRINDEQVAYLAAQNTRTISDKPGDFIGDRAPVCEYACVINQDHCNEIRLLITHDRRYGWQGLLHKILGEIIPIVVETISEEES